MDSGTGLSELLKDLIYAARVAADGSPVLVDRSFLLTHVHFLGSTGSGKTSMGLVPLVEQIIRNGKSSVIMLNLKGRSLEGYSAMVAAQQELLARTGQSIPIKVFSLENGVRTHIFNPLLSPAWRRLSEVEKSEVLNNAYGLNFGQSYGAKWFGDSAAEFSLTSLLANPNTISFRNLLVEAQRILKSSRAGELPPEVKRAGIHAWLLTKRMAAVDALNLTQSPLEAPDALEHQIDLTECFSSPQLCYFNLPSMTAPNTAPAIARLVTHFLMTAGQYVENKVRVHLVIDEFQNMVSDSLEQVFAMARSLNISLILANQNMSDIHAKSRILANSIESNCHWRQWFSVKTREDIKALEELFGTREELKTSWTHTDKGTNTSQWIDDVPRVKSPDLQTISDNPNLSILHITGDRKGYGRYRGIPFVVRSEFHISKVEFERRERGPWPTDLPGMITGGTTHKPTAADESLDASDLGIDDKTATPKSSNFQSELFE